MAPASSFVFYNNLYYGVGLRSLIKKQKLRPLLWVEWPRSSQMKMFQLKFYSILLHLKRRIEPNNFFFKIDLEAKHRKLYGVLVLFFMFHETIVIIFVVM